MSTPSIDLSALHPALQSAFKPLIYPLRTDVHKRAVWPAGLTHLQPAPEAPEAERAWDDPIDDADAQHDMRRDWALEDTIPVGEAVDSDFGAFLEASK